MAEEIAESNQLIPRLSMCKDLKTLTAWGEKAPLIRLALVLSFLDCLTEVTNFPYC